MAESQFLKLILNCRLPWSLIWLKWYRGPTEPCNVGLGALCEPLLLHMLPESAHRTGVNAVTSNVNVKCLLPGQWLELQPQQQWTVKISVYISRDCPIQWDRQSRHNIAVPSPNPVCSEKGMCYIFRVCVSVLPSVTQPAHRIFFCAIFYCHQWPVWLYCIFAHYPTNGITFREPLLHIKCVLIFSTTSAWNISRSKNNSGKFYHKFTYVFM